MSLCLAIFTAVLLLACLKWSWLIDVGDTLNLFELDCLTQQTSKVDGSGPKIRVEIATIRAELRRLNYGPDAVAVA